MKNVRSASSLFQVAALLFFIAVAVAWRTDTTKAIASPDGTVLCKDTTPSKSAHPDEIDLQLNLDSVMQQVNITLSKIDYAKINADTKKAVAEVDFNKINVEVNAALKNIDWAKMKMDISTSLDSAKMAINAINWDEMKAEVAKAGAETQKAMAAQKINLNSMHIQLQKSLGEAQKGLQAAKADWHNCKALAKALEADGLLQAGKPYTIELKEGVLYLNGVKQTKATTDKYNKYYSGKKNFTLKNDGGEDL